MYRGRGAGPFTVHHPKLAGTEGSPRPPPPQAMPLEPFAASRYVVPSPCPGPFSRRPVVPCSRISVALVDRCKKLGSSSPLLLASVYSHLLFDAGLGARLGTMAHREKVLKAPGSPEARQAEGLRGPWTGRKELALELVGGAIPESDPVSLNSLGEVSTWGTKMQGMWPSCWAATPWEDSPGQDAGYSWGSFGDSGWNPCLLGGFELPRVRLLCHGDDGLGTHVCCSFCPPAAVPTSCPFHLEPRSS